MDDGYNDGTDKPKPKSKRKSQPNNFPLGAGRVSTGHFRRRNVSKNIFTTSFTNSVKSNNSSLAKRLANLKEQMGQVLEENREISKARAEDRIRYANERLFYNEHIVRIDNYVVKGVSELNSFVNTITKVLQEVAIVKDFQTRTSDIYSQSRQCREDYNRVSGGSKTQTVNPMVSGLTITQPTVSLARVDSSNIAYMGSSRGITVLTNSSSNRGATDISNAQLLPIVEEVGQMMDVADPIIDDAEPIIDDVEPIIDDVEPIIDDVELNDEGASDEDETNDDEMEASLLSRSKRSKLGSRNGSNQNSSESQAQFYERVRSEDAQEGTSQSRGYRRLPQKIPMREPTPNVPSLLDETLVNRTSFEEVNMDETSVLLLSPIKEFHVHSSEVNPHVATTPSQAQANRLDTDVLGSDKNMKKLLCSVGSKSQTRSAKHSPPLGPRCVSNLGATLVPCTVKLDMPAEDILDSAKSSVITHPSAFPSSCVTSTGPINVSGVAIIPCSVNMSSDNRLDMPTLPSLEVLELSSVLKQSSVPYTSQAITLTPCTVNLSTATPSNSIRQSSVHSLIASSAATSVDADGSSSALPTTASAPAYRTFTITPACMYNKNEHTNGSGKHCETANSLSENTPLETRVKKRNEYPPARSGEITLNKNGSDKVSVHTAITDKHRNTGSRKHKNNVKLRTATPASSTKAPASSSKAPASSSKAPASSTAGSLPSTKLTESDGGRMRNGAEQLLIKKQAKSSKKPKARHSEKPAANLAVENEETGDYSETPRMPRNDKLCYAQVLVTKLVAGEAGVKNDQDQEKSISPRRALRRIGPTNYKEPKINIKMRRTEGLS